MKSKKYSANMSVTETLNKGYGICKNQYKNRETVMFILYKKGKQIRWFWADIGAKSKKNPKVYFIDPFLLPNSTLQLVTITNKKGDFEGYRWAIEQSSSYTNRLVSKLCKTKQECIDEIHKMEKK